MSELMWIRSHVEQLLAREWDVCRVAADEDGDYMFPAGTALCWVSVLDGETPMIRITAHAAYDLKPGAKLLRELNDIQHRCLSAAIRLTGDVVVVSQTISPIGLTKPVLSQAMDAVARVAADIGPLLAAMFDGTTPLDPATSTGIDRSSDAGTDAA